MAQPAAHNMKYDEEADSFERHSAALDDIKALDLVGKSRDCSIKHRQVTIATM